MASRGNNKKVVIAFSVLMLGTPVSVWANGAVPANPTNPEGTSIRERWFGWMPGRKAAEPAKPTQTAVPHPVQPPYGELNSRQQIRTTNVYQSNHAHLDPMMEQQNTETHKSFWERIKFGKKAEPKRDFEVVGGAKTNGAAAGAQATPRAVTANPRQNTASQTAFKPFNRPTATPTSTANVAAKPAQAVAAKPAQMVPPTGFAPNYANNMVRPASGVNTSAAAVRPAAVNPAHDAADSFASAGARPIPIPVAKRRSTGAANGVAKAPTFRTPSAVAARNVNVAPAGVRNPKSQSPAAQPVRPTPAAAPINHLAAKPAAPAMQARPTNNNPALANAPASNQPAASTPGFFGRLKNRFRRSEPESTGTQLAASTAPARPTTTVARAPAVEPNVRRAVNQTPTSAAAQPVVPVSAQTSNAAATATNANYQYRSQQMAPAASEAKTPAPPAFRGWEDQ